MVLEVTLKVGWVPPAFSCQRSDDPEPEEVAANAAELLRSHQSVAFEPSQIVPPDPLPPKAVLVTATKFEEVMASPPAAVETLNVSYS